MSEWYYARGGQRVGPLSLEALLELARSGRFGPADLVWHASLPAWTPASQVEALAGVTFPEPVPPPMPASPSPSASSNPYAAPQSVWIDSAATSAGAGVAEWQEISPGSDPIDATMCVSRGFELTKRHYLTIFIVGVVYLGCQFASSFAMSFLEIAARSIATGSLDLSQTTPDGGGLLVLSVVLNLVLQVFYLFLQLGLLRIGLNLVSGQEATVGMMFGEGDKLLRAIGASILFMIAFLIGLVLLIVPGIYIALRYGHFITAIVDRNLGIFDAFEYSSRITEENRLNLFVLGLLNLLIVIAGFLACLVGLAFALPVAWLAGLVAYRWMQYGRDVVHDR